MAHDRRMRCRYVSVAAIACLWLAAVCVSSVHAQSAPDRPSATSGADPAQIAGDRRQAHRTTLDAAAFRIYVSPTGDDQWSGLRPSREAHGQEGPLKTIVAAQAKARQATAKMAAGQLPSRAVHVILEPGVYTLASSLVFDERDSGRPANPVVYAAERPGTVVISGGVALLPAQATGANVTLRLPPATSVDWSGAHQLFVDGRRATLARQPNEGQYWFVQEADSTGDAGKGGAVNAFRTAREATAWINALGEQDRRGAVVNLYHAWTTGRHRLAGAMPDRIALDPAPRWAFLRFGRSQRFFVENVAAALDAPGEWFGEADKVTFMPQPDQRGRSVGAVLPVLDKLIVMRGNQSTGALVEHLELRGLDLEHTRYATPASGYTDNQAASTIGAAIEVDRARDIVIDDCRLRHLGTYGIWLRSKVRDSILSNNILTDLGAGGIRVGMTSQAADDPSQTGAITVTGNVVTVTGRVFPGAVGIWLGQTWDNRIVQNLVANTSYSGVSVGWRWGYGGATSGRNTIASNALFNIGQGGLSDMGGIYMLGEAPGTVVRGNLIREVRAYAEYGPDGRAGGWGIYQDEGTSDTVVEGNVVVGTDSGGYHLHYGRRNVVRGNLLALGEQSEIRVTKTEPTQTRLFVSGNLLIPDASQPFYGFATPPDVQFEANVVSSATGATQVPIDLMKCKPGCEQRPLRLKAGSLPKAIEVEGLTDGMPTAWRAALSGAGPAVSELYADKAVEGRVRSVQVAPTEAIHVDIAGTAIGDRPVGLNFRPKDDAAAIRVVEDRTAPAGNRCLKFEDSDRFSQRFEPFAFATLGRTEGRWASRLSLWIDERAEFIHEWRDDSKPYKAGPSMVITAKGVLVNNKLVAPVRPRTWTTYTVTAALGRDAGVWNLEIKEEPSGTPRRITGLPLRTPGWNELRWVGFVSNAPSNAAACIGAIAIDASAAR
jgi:hypothetical protein